MKGSINFSSDSLIRVQTSSALPEVGSSSAIYYIVDTNSFVIWDSSTSGWIKFKTRINMWQLMRGNLKDITQEETVVQTSDLESINEGITVAPDLGDIVFDSFGASANVVGVKNNGEVTLRTQQANLTKKISYADQSWEMWISDEDDGGHYFWDSKTNTLRCEKFNRDVSNPIAYESFVINGGGPNYEITGGTKIGARQIISWDGKSAGEGTLRCYYTKSKENDTITSNDEVATIGDVYTILYAESGIYCGTAETEKALNDNMIVGNQGGHVICNNDWVYVLHYAPNVIQYDEGTSFSTGMIIEYNYELFQVEEDFDKTDWATDKDKCYSYDGTRCTFIFRESEGIPGQWVYGVEVEPDIPEPDESALTTNSRNKMTIKDSGVVTSHLSNSSVTNQKLASLSVTNDKIANSTIAKGKLDKDLQNTITKAENCWYKDNLIISNVQPTAPTQGYIIWIDCDISSL